MTKKQDGTLFLVEKSFVFTFFHGRPIKRNVTKTRVNLFPAAERRQMCVPRTRISHWFLTRCEVPRASRQPLHLPCSLRSPPSLCLNHLFIFSLPVEHLHLIFPTPAEPFPQDRVRVWVFACFIPKKWRAWRKKRISPWLFLIQVYIIRYVFRGAVAQLARAIRSHRIGRGFNSHLLHHSATT